MNETPEKMRDSDGFASSQPAVGVVSGGIRRVGYRVVDMIAQHLTTLPEKPVFRPFPAGLAAKYLNSKPPEAGLEADDILATFAQEIEPYPFGNGHPRFYGWVNSPPVVLGIFAEALAAMSPSCHAAACSRGRLRGARGHQLV